MKTSKLLSPLQGLLFLSAVASLAVYLVLCWQGFYAMNIDWYSLDTYLGVPKEYLLEAYSEVMAYCMGQTSQFSAGIFYFSQEGADHFFDVRNIFIWVGYLAKSTPVLYIILKLVQRKDKLKSHRFFGRSPEFCAVIAMFFLLAIIGCYAAMDFNQAFTLFHMIFFPGQSNWLFNPATDPVIYALPEEFFRNCGILIGGLILLGCGIAVFFEITGAKKANQARQESLEN